MSQDFPNETTVTNGDLVAAIDLGSNSFHMIVARASQGELRQVDARADRLQMAAGLKDGHLTSETTERALACLLRYRQLLDALQPNAVRAVGTNTLRAAKNAGDFINRGSLILGHPIEVISGREEARLIYLGVAHTLADDDHARLVVDIGGGSTEFIIGQRFEPKLTESLHMGCVSWSKRFFPNGSISAAGFEAAYRAAYLEVLNIRKEYQQLGWNNAVGSSGTLNAIASAINPETGIREINREGLALLKEQVLSCRSTAELANIGSIKKSRRGVIAAGLSICCALFDSLDLDTMQTSSGALREGVAYDTLGRLSHEDVRSRSVEAMMGRYHVNIDHARRVDQVSQDLFAQARKPWQLGETDGELLSWAARLHEVGLSIAHSQFHKHGEYLVSHADLPGFSVSEQKELSLLVRCHRRKFAIELFEGLEVQHSTRLQRLCVLLRLAVLSKYVVAVEGDPDFKLRIDGNNCRLVFPGNWLESHPLTAEELAREQILLTKSQISLIL